MVTEIAEVSGARVSGVLFDVDDTLVDTKGAFRHALAGVARQYLTADAGLAAVALFWRADRHGSYRAHTRGEMDHREQRKRRANDLHAEFGGPLLDDDAYDSWDEVFEQSFQEGWRAHDDAAACLDALDAAGIPYGALSNARFDYQRQKLHAVGLERVPMLVGVDTLGFGKPDPRVFHLAAEKLGLDPGAIAYVGDEYDIDAVAAARAGLKGVWIDRSGDIQSDDANNVAPSVGESEQNPTLRIGSLEALLAAIGASASGAKALVLDEAKNTLK